MRVLSNTAAVCVSVFCCVFVFVCVAWLVHLVVLCLCCRWLCCCFLVDRHVCLVLTHPVSDQSVLSPHVSTTCMCHVTYQYRVCTHCRKQRDRNYTHNHKHHKRKARKHTHTHGNSINNNEFRQKYIDLYTDL